MRVKGNALSFGIRNIKRSIKDPLPYSLQELNTKVWNKWYPKKVRKYKCNGKAMMEIYSLTIWIAKISSAALGPILSQKKDMDADKDPIK